jgi:hypothetical protein
MEDRMYSIRVPGLRDSLGILLGTVSEIKGANVMATLKTRFEELEIQLLLTSDRTEQDKILDSWLEYRQAVPVESALARAWDPETWGRRSRAALEPSVGRRIRFA